MPVDIEDAANPVVLSRDELEMIELFRSMKAAHAKQSEDEALRSPSEEKFPYDEAIVVAHSIEANRVQFGFVRLDPYGKENFELFSFLSDDDHAKLKEIWSPLFSETGEVMDDQEHESKLARYISKQFDSARASHEHAREVIARYDNTNLQAEEASRRTRELLSHKKN